METETERMNRRFNEWLRTSGLYDRLFDAGGREPRWRYFEHNGWMFGWTTERMGDGKFAAFIYKPLGGDRYECAKEVHFAKRMTAKAKARRWYELTMEQASGRPPARILK